VANVGGELGVAQERVRDAEREVEPDDARSVVQNDSLGPAAPEQPARDSDPTINSPASAHASRLPTGQE